MTRTEAALKYIVRELQTRQCDLDVADRMRSLTITVFYDKTGKVCSTDFSKVERTLIA